MLEFFPRERDEVAGDTVNVVAGWLLVRIQGRMLRSSKCVDVETINAIVTSLSVLDSTHKFSVVSCFVLKAKHLNSHLLHRLEHRRTSSI